MSKNKRSRLTELYSQLSWRERLELYFHASMRRWLILERQQVEAYAGRNQPWYALEPAQEKNTARMHLISVACAVLVLALSALFSANNPAGLMMIPAFALFTVLLLTLRQLKLQALEV